MARKRADGGGVGEAIVSILGRHGGCTVDLVLAMSTARSQQQLDLDLDRLLGLAARSLEGTEPCAGRVSLRCDGCGRQWDLRFACTKPCAQCPWQAQRRSASTLGLLPRVPVRHWVFNLPGPWRGVVVKRPELLRRATNLFMQEVFALVRKAVSAKRGGVGVLHCGGATVVHRSGSALDLHVHLHALVLDGAYSFGPRDGAPVFHALASDPAAGSLQRLTRRLHGRLRSMFSVTVDPGPSSQGALQQRMVGGPPAAPCPRRIAEPSGPRPSPLPGTGVVRNGLRVHVGAAVSPDDRPAMVRLVRYVQRPIVDPASFEPRYPDAIRYRLAHPFSDGTTHVEFSAQALADKLGALVPPSSSPRTAYHGILAPKAAKRWRVVPAQLELASRVLAFAPNSPVRSAGPRKAPNKADGSVGECRHCGGPVVIVRLEETHAQEDGHAA